VNTNPDEMSDLLTQYSLRESVTFIQISATNIEEGAAGKLAVAAFLAD
jgi:hypothetical protein